MIRFLTNWAIPGWATYATGTLAIIMIQLITIATSFTFFVLSNRTNLGFVPLRDYSLFVEEAVETSILMSEFKYAGSELDLFADVWNWKAYWSRQIRPFLTGDILEVGAGIGSNTRFLDPGVVGTVGMPGARPELDRQLVKNLAETKPRRAYETVCGTLESLAGQQFDTIVYIDVLEHIDNDREELDRAASHLRPGGHLIVLSPAHQRLFSPFDAAIGHFRRYNRPMLRRISPASLRSNE